MQRGKKGIKEERHEIIEVMKQEQLSLGKKKSSKLSEVKEVMSQKSEQ